MYTAAPGAETRLFIFKNFSLLIFHQSKEMSTSLLERCGSYILISKTMCEYSVLELLT